MRVHRRKCFVAVSQHLQAVKRQMYAKAVVHRSETVLLDVATQQRGALQMDRRFIRRVALS
jgi:hypothetical protein